MESRGRTDTTSSILEELFTVFYIKEEHQRRLNETDERNGAPSSTTLYDLPLEMLDIILQMSYLHWILNSTTKKSDNIVIKTLISVDICFSRRIIRKRFKNTIWRYLKEFYGKTKKITVIVRNNRNYLLENIQPSYELIASLLSLNCLTQQQGHIIQRQRSTRDKNEELLALITSFNEKKFSNLFKCLRRTNQHTVARIIENGGGVIKVDVQTPRGANDTTSMETQLHVLHQNIEDLRNRTRPWSDETDTLIGQLTDEGIEILNSQLDRQQVVVWIWCHSQEAFEHIQKLYESNHLKDLFLENIQPSISIVIRIDWNQFKQTVVVRPISINCAQRIEVERNAYVWGLTKLRTELYVLCDTQNSSKIACVILVFEDRNPFRFQRKIEIKKIRPKGVIDIASSEKENCLYIAGQREKCVWKVTKENDDQHKVIKWLTLDYDIGILGLSTLSVSTDGRLLMVYGSWSILVIYGSDAELIRRIHLPRDVMYPRHAVETSIGNFIILHEWWEEKEDKRESWSTEINKVGWALSEVTRDGQMVIRRFIPANKTQKLNYPFYLSIDSDDHVFVADTDNNRVILLDSNLKWNRILCPTKEEEETRIEGPFRLYYDEEKKQLIVDVLGVSVYTLSRN